MLGLILLVFVSSANAGPVSPAVVEAFANDDLEVAIQALRASADCPKGRHLLRQASRIVAFEASEEPERTTAHQTWRSIGVAYHNLYLFLKAQGRTGEAFADEAHRYYKKARRKGTKLHKAECDLLLASLLGAQGEIQKANKKFSKVDLKLLKGGYEAAEYRATYHAAVDEIDEAIAALDEAYALDPERTRMWLAITDDFASIAGDTRFSQHLATWQKPASTSGPTLSPPLSTAPCLEVRDASGLIKPATSMPSKRRRKRR